MVPKGNRVVIPNRDRVWLWSLAVVPKGDGIDFPNGDKFGSDS